MCRICPMWNADRRMTASRAPGTRAHAITLECNSHNRRITADCVKNARLSRTFPVYHAASEAGIDHLTSTAKAGKRRFWHYGDPASARRLAMDWVRVYAAVSSDAVAFYDMGVLPPQNREPPVFSRCRQHFGVA